MLEPIDQLKKTLKEQGLSLTTPRRIIFSYLQKPEPQTMNALIKSCLGEVDRATVYRTISLFEQLGIVKRLQIGWKYQLELSNSFHHHHHLACLNCGRIIHFDADNALENRLKAVAQANNFTMQDHQLEIQGLCQQCSKS